MVGENTYYPGLSTFARGNEDCPSLSCCCVLCGGSFRAPATLATSAKPQVLREVDTIADLSELSEEQLQPILGSANASKLYKFFRQPAPL